jgi:hypothetical protein
MHRSSETIGAIAAALAKAQAELTNPEKALSAAIQSQFPREGTETSAMLPWAAASMSARAGRQEIATVQTTAIDQSSGPSSSRPFWHMLWRMDLIGTAGLPSRKCAPHRMGGSPTYARVTHCLHWWALLARTTSMCRTSRAIPTINTRPAPIGQSTIQRPANGTPSMGHGSQSQCSCPRNRKLA